MRLRCPRTLRSRLVAGAALAVAAAALVLFPGRRLVFALAVGTGIGRDALQARVDAVEEKAVRGEPFSADDRAFLVDLYRTIATGGRVVVFARRSGRLLHHYLDGSGADLRLDPGIFTGNAKVRRRMAALRAAAAAAPVDEPVALSSGTFYMPDASQADSVYGLYDGTLRVERVAAPGGARVLRWRAEVPWTWPSYAEIELEHGDPHAECFPLPSVASAWLGGEPLRIDNGLGERLAQEGLARPFLAYAEWDEPLEPVR